MTTGPMVAKNIDLAFEIAFQWLADPRVADEAMELADGGTLVLYDDADEELTVANDRMADSLVERGEPVVRAVLQRRTTLNPR